MTGRIPSAARRMLPASGRVRAALPRAEPGLVSPLAADRRITPVTPLGPDHARAGTNDDWYRFYAPRRIAALTAQQIADDSAAAERDLDAVLGAYPSVARPPDPRGRVRLGAPQSRARAARLQPRRQRGHRPRAARAGPRSGGGGRPRLRDPAAGLRPGARRPLRGRPVALRPEPLRLSQRGGGRPEPASHGRAAGARRVARVRDQRLAGRPADGLGGPAGDGRGDRAGRGRSRPGGEDVHPSRHADRRRRAARDARAHSAALLAARAAAAAHGERVRPAGRAPSSRRGSSRMPRAARVCSSTRGAPEDSGGLAPARRGEPSSKVTESAVARLLADEVARAQILEGLLDLRPACS